MLKRKRNSEAGFTLVEIAIVMVIIGLLIGGILKGQEMIKNAKIKRVMKQADELRVAAMSYQDRFKFLPGDDNAANTRPNAGGNTNGNGNGMIAAAEAPLVFQHLSTANLISGSYDGTTATYPRNPFGGQYYVLWTARNGTTTHWFHTTLIPGDVAAIIDAAEDDGVQTTGSIRGSAAYTPGTTVTMYIEF